MNTETKVTGKKYRVCTDATNKNYDRYSYWTDASDVEFADGTDAKTNLGNIKGITDSLASTSSNIALSAKAGKELNESLTGKQDKLMNPLTQESVINDLASAYKNLPLSANQGRILNETKQNNLLHNSFVSTNTADDNGNITLSIDISSLKLSSKPLVALLQGQNAGFYSIERYIYSFDHSTATSVVFAISYGSSAANKSVSDRYGFVIFP